MKMRTKRLALVLAAAFVAGLLCWQIFAPHQTLALNVALYPYVPDATRFEQAIRTEWERTHPDVMLNFVTWDCYDEDPPDDVDVFVFDSVFLGTFVNNGNLLPIPDDAIQDRDDFVPFALEGCSVDGELYALPQLLCADVLYTRKGDTELEGVTNVTELHEALGDHTSQQVLSSTNVGLLMDMTGGTDKTLKYLQALVDSE